MLLAQLGRSKRCKLTFDLLTLKVVSESRVTWATSVPNLVFLGLSVLDLGSMYATDKRTSDRQTSDVRQTSDAYHRLMPPPYGGGGIIKRITLHSVKMISDAAVLGDLSLIVI